MISVIVLGTGNVGSHLIKAFLKNPSINLTQVFDRKKSALKAFDKKVDTTTTIEQLKNADVYVLAISDDAIITFSKKLINLKGLVVHTSGSVSLNALKSNSRRGVFYPVQTFSKNKKINLNSVPLCIETENKKDLILLEKLASHISYNVYYIDSAQRKKLHLAAVFVNNFVNYMYSIGYDICQENNIPFEILHPLIKETSRKIMSNDPNSVQTGPACRNDLKTIESHLKLLSANKKNIYELLTKSILKINEKKL
jgi:predicted short-subunit dehydrogenase-like oxidoreductase (DUF2520 family)